MKTIESRADLDAHVARSGDKPVFLIKHSTRCPVSTTALEQYRRFVDDAGDGDHAYLDLIAHRDVSDAIAADSGVRHESPQALLYHRGQVVWHDSHGRITADRLASALAEAAGSGNTTSESSN